MWMVESSEKGDKLKVPDQLSSRRLIRPLTPRPIVMSNEENSTSCGATSPCHCCIEGTNKSYAWNQHPTKGAMTSPSPQEINMKREMNNNKGDQPLIISSRWNPTREQIEALEDMYRRGMRTPSAQQIQQITAKLRKFGKIEGKNVFYWFQNHKARERQKLRRRLEALSSGKRKQQTELRMKDLGVDEHSKLLATPPNFNILSEDSSLSMHRKMGWTQFSTGIREILHLQRQNENWPLADYYLSSCVCPNCTLFNGSNSLISSKGTTIEAQGTTCSAYPPVDDGSPVSSKGTKIAVQGTTLSAQLPADDGLNLDICLPNYSKNDHFGENQTLELFPIVKEDIGVSTMDTKFSTTPNQFFEFLPPKY